MLADSFTMPHITIPYAFFLGPPDAADHGVCARLADFRQPMPTSFAKVSRAAAAESTETP